MADPKIGEDGLVFEDRPLSMSVLQAVPTELGLWKSAVVYTSLEANDDYLVVGSEQGVVWVVDLETAKLTREYNEFRGTSITVLKFCPAKDLLAYGTSDGHVRIEKVSRPTSNKWRIQEKANQAVRALEWRGDNLFCGFDLGRVIQLQINIHDGTLSPLTFPDSYGSAVTQLSCKGNSLLVSTVERMWIVDTETHKLEQVGRKDRKPGQYGGCLMRGGERAYVARPGLRLWTADNTGKVLSTVVFKEALSSRHLPRVPLHSWSSLVPSYNRAWQFSSVRPWVGEHFIVTLSDHTLFVLDPENGLTVGVLTLGQKITDLAVTRGFVYLLCNDLKKPVCRVSVKQSFLRALKKSLPISPAHSPAPSKKQLALDKPTPTTPLAVSSHSPASKTTGAREIQQSEESSESAAPTSLPQSGESRDCHMTSHEQSKPTEEPKDHVIPATEDIPDFASSSLCEYMDDDTESQEEAPQDTHTEEGPHTHTPSHPTALEGGSTLLDDTGGVSAHSVDPAPPTEPSDGVLLAGTVDAVPSTAVEETEPSPDSDTRLSAKMSQDYSTKPETNAQPERVSGEQTDPPSEQPNTTTQLPSDADPPSEQPNTTTQLPSDADPPSEQPNTTTQLPSDADPPSEQPNTTTQLPSDADPPSEQPNTTTQLPSDADPPSEQPNTTTQLPSDADPPSEQPNTTTQLPSDADPPSEQPNTTTQLPSDADPPSEQPNTTTQLPSDTKADTSGETQAAESQSSTCSEQSENTAEPTLQEALQNVKAEMKELFKPGFDKLSNIFKGTNQGALSPKRIRVVASRKKRSDDEEKPDGESHDLSVVIEREKVNSQTNTSKDDYKTSKRPDLKEILKIGVGNLLNKEAPSNTPSDVPVIITPAPLDLEEQERRLKMSQSRREDEDDVVVVKKDKKRKKKRKYKKISSATSSVSVSLEKLTEIEEEYDDCPTPLSAIITPLSRTASPCPPFTLTEEQTSRLEQLKAERNEENEREHSVLESLPENHHEEEETLKDAHPSPTQPSEQTRLEQDQVDTVSEPPAATENTNEQSNETDDIVQPSVVAAPHCDESTDAPELRVDTDYVPLFQDDDTPPKAPPTDKPSLEVVPPRSVSPSSIAESQEKNVTTLGDLSDNPLYYHDSDQEPASLSAPFPATASPRRGEGESRTRSTLTRYRPSVLQPGDFDPLQSDDSYEGGFSSREDKLVDHTPVNLRPRMTTGSSEKKRFDRHNRPSPVVSGSWSGGYVPVRGARELSAEGSDSSRDEDEDLNVEDSEVVPDFYKLCGSLVRHSNENKETKVSAPEARKFSWAASEFQRESIVESDEETGAEGPASNADIWVPIPHPGRSHIQCICLSDTLLWVVDGKRSVFCTTTSSKGRDWQLIKPSMEQVCSSPSGKIVWGVHHHNAYVRLGIGLNPAGSTWKHTTKRTFMSRKIKRLAVSEDSVWAITTDNRTIFRKGVEESTPDGRVWQEVRGEGFSHISCCKNIVWAHTSLGKVFVRDGITPSTPSGKRWVECKCPKLTASCLTRYGVAWGINSEGSIGFKCGVTSSKPAGKGAWWEVKINALTHPSSPYNSLWQVMGSEGSHLLTSVLPHLSHHTKPLVLSASSKAGVVILQDSNRLHACWRTATGYHYRPASKNGLFPLTTWANIAAGFTGLWLVRDDGDLHCLTANDKLKRIECPAAIKLLAASPTCLWIVADNLVWSRQGLSQDTPEGVSFDYIEVSPLMHERKIRSITCGNSAVWALDNTGVPHFRFGVHSREPGTGMSPAWIPVEDNASPLLQISVCPDNWLVWACGEKFNSYVRTGVTSDFPIGRKWELVLGEQIKEVCVTNEYVYGLTPNGELLCRYGISEENVQGNYWRRMPGKYEHLATGKFGELWTLDSKGQVWKQEWKVLTVSQDPKAGQDDFETSMVVDQSWEVV